MSCNCQTVTPVSPTGDCLPTVADDCALAKPTSICKPCPEDPNCLVADGSDGTTLASSWTDACCYNENVTLLARVGDKLARFTGTGFLSFVSGKASLVAAVPLKLVHIWHRWWKPTAASTPILGEPLDFNYQAVGDSEGNLHAIKGISDEDSETVWKHEEKVFRQTPQSELKRPLKGLLPRAVELELIGYAPIPDDGSITLVRQLSSLAGSGILIVEQQDTVANPDEPCDESLASVAKFLALPVPVAAETYSLKYSTALGLHWSEDV